MIILESPSMGTVKSGQAMITRTRLHPKSNPIRISQKALIFWDQNIFFEISVVLNKLRLGDIENGCIGLELGKCYLHFKLCVNSHALF